MAHNNFINSFQFFIGLSSKKIVCKNGKCRPDKSAGYSDACEEICGFSSCLDAQPDPGVCDLTKFIGESASGRQKLCFNSKRNLKLDCLVQQNLKREFWP